MIDFLLILNSLALLQILLHSGEEEDFFPGKGWARQNVTKRIYQNSAAQAPQIIVFDFVIYPVHADFKTVEILISS